MNIGQAPPCLIWPYALFYILTRRSLFFMLGVLSAEQTKYHEFYDRLRVMLQERIDDMYHIVSNSPDASWWIELMDFTINALLLYYGAIFLLLLKIYILIRHLNYMVFAILFYVSSIAFGQSDRSESRQRTTVD